MFLVRFLPEKPNSLFTPKTAISRCQNFDSLRQHTAAASIGSKREPLQALAVELLVYAHGIKGIMNMKTVFLLMAQYDATAVIPVESVVKDYFPHLTVKNFLGKVAKGDIHIPLLRMEVSSQKTAKGVHISDLAAYIDERRAAAVKEAKQMGMSVDRYAPLK